MIRVLIISSNTSGHILNRARSERPDPRQKLARLIGEVHRLWRSRLNDRLRPLGLSQSRWMALRILSRGGAALRQHELAARLGVEPPTLVGLLDCLERDGLIERRGAATDRRSKTVHLTRKARGRIRRINTIADRLRREILGEIDPAALATATRVLESIQDRLSDGDVG